MARNNIKGTSQGHNQPSIKSEIGSSGHEVETGRGFSLSRKPYRLETARAERNYQIHSGNPTELWKVTI